MKEIHIDCVTLDGPREFHWKLQKLLSFPEWYGSNLDALHDCLTAVSEDTHLIFVNWDHMAAFSRPFRRVLEDSCRENPHLRITIANIQRESL